MLALERFCQDRLLDIRGVVGKDNYLKFMPQHVERRTINPHDICNQNTFGPFIEALPAISKGRIMKVERYPDAERGTSMYSVFFKLNPSEAQVLTVQYVPLQIVRSNSFRGGDYSDEQHDGIFFDMHLCTIERLPRIDKNIVLSVAHATSDVVAQWWKRRSDSYVYVKIDNHIEIRLGLEVFNDITLSHLIKLIGMYVNGYKPLDNYCKSYLNQRVFTIKQPKK